MKKNNIKERLRKALVVLLTVAMVTTQTPISYAVEASMSEDSTTQTTGSSRGNESKAVVAQSENAAATSEVNADAPVVETVVDTQPTTSAQPTGSGVEGEADVALSFEHAYLTYAGQIVAAPATKITVPTTADMLFEVHPDTDYQVSSVQYELGSQRTTLEPGADGLYKLTAEHVVNGAKLTLTAVPVPGAQATTAGDAKDYVAIEETQKNETQDPATTQEEKKDQTEAKDQAATTDKETSTDQATADAAKTEAKKQPNTQTEFVYEDDAVKVTATLTDPAAIPAGAEFKVTPVTKQSTGYNYDAYMDALNKSDASDDFKYDSNNTLLYDVAFMIDKTDANGNVVEGQKVEYEPESGKVKIDIQFKHAQLKNEINASTSQSVEVNHLPLTSKVRDAVDSTEAAANITASDVVVESVVNNVNVDAENVSLTTTSLSVISITANSQNKIVAQIQLKDANGNPVNAQLSAPVYLQVYNSQWQMALKGFDYLGNGLYQTTITALSWGSINAGDAFTGKLYQTSANVNTSDPQNALNNIQNKTELEDGSLVDGKYILSLPNSTQLTANQPYMISMSELAPPGGETYRDILGDAINFGILTNNFVLNQGDAETNVAARTGRCTVQTGNDLTNHEEQTFILAHIDGEFKIKGENAYVRTNSNDAGKVISTGGVVTTIDTSKTAEELEAEIDAMYEAVTASSNALANKAPNATISPRKDDGSKYEVDLTGRGPGTFYVTVDDATYQKAFAENGKFRIVKSDDQTVVFNITANPNVVQQFYIGDQGAANFITQHDHAKPSTVVCNFINATNVQIAGSILGVIIAPRATIKVDATSCGWLIANKVEIGAGEWHNVYQEIVKLNEGSEVAFKAKKTIDNENANVNGFTFKLEKKNGDTWTEVGTAANNGVEVVFGSVAFDQNNFTSTGTTQEHVFRISEVSGDVDSNGRRYHSDTNVYYAKTTVKKAISKTASTEKTTYIADRPVYYSDEACTQPINDVPTFNNTTETQEQFTKVSVNKVWADNNNAAGLRPASVTVHLYADGVDTDKSAQLSAANNWSHTFDQLAVGPQYTVVEDGVNNYTTAVSGSMGNGFTITNTYIEKTQATVQKVWDDDNNYGGKRPTSLEVKLMADGVDKQTVTLNSPNWMATVSNLPKYEGDHEIVYTWEEVNVPEGYTVSPATKNGTVTTITNTAEKTSATVRKVWNDAENQDGKRPGSLTVALSNGATVTLNESNHWEATVGNLPKYANGQEIAYTWTEQSLPDGYTLTDTSKEGAITTLTNSHTPETTEATVKKVWNDANNQDGKRPADLSVTLKAGEETKQTVTLNEGNKWEAKVTGLPKYANGREIAYTWTEDVQALPEGYSLNGTTQNGTVTTLTNSYTPETTEATVKKVWNDANNQDGKRPTELKVTLSNGTEVTLNADNNWEATVGDLPKYANGTEIEYAWTEGALPKGYTLTNTAKEGTVTTLTNTHTPETTEATVKKVWDDANNQDGKRPTELKVTLSNGAEVTLNADNNWEATVGDLPKYANGTEIVYTWTEGALPEGYALTDTSVNGTVTTLTNSYNTEETQATVKKVWNDSNNQDGKRPAELTVTLKAGKEAKQTVTLNARNDWTATVEHLPAYKDGQEIAYTWSEGELPQGYALTDTSVNGTITTLTNTHQTEETEASVKKVWDDANNQDGKRPSSINVTLKGGDEERTVTLTQANGWEATITGLPKYKDGQEINYTWSEDDAAKNAGYNLSGNEKRGTVTTLTNSYTTEETEARVKKVWDDANNQDGIRPASLTVTLSDGQQVTLDEGNKWEAKVTGLPKYKDGKEIAYTWTESGLPAGYELTDTSVNGTVTTLTNTHKTAETEATVKKVWDDANNQDGIRPASLTVTLSNGDKVILDNANGWTATVKGLPTNKDGKKIAYTWTEEGLPEGYTLTGNSTEGTITTLTNTHKTAETEATVKKVWDDANNQDGIRPASLTVTLSDGQAVTLNEANGWQATITGLPKYANGQEIAYTWTESGLPEGYALESNKAEGTVTTLTNTHKTAETEATVKKVWDDANNQDGKRPAELKVTLSNGDEVTLNADNNWTATITGLPKFAGGKEIAYTWTESGLPEGYTLTGNSTEGTITTITNRHDVELTEATVRKVWDDANNQDGIRPAEIKATLSNGAEVTLNADNNWSATVTGLPKYANGQEIAYTWTESGLPEGYVLESNKAEGTITTLTNKHETAKTEATVKKVWDDEGNRNGKRPAELKVNLSDGQQVTLNDKNEWTATIKDLPKFANGTEITYAWTEESLPAGYVLSGTATEGTITTLTNTYNANGELTFAGMKTMEGRAFQTGDAFTFTITADDAQAPMPAQSTVTVQPTSGTAVPLNFGNVKFSKADIGKTYTYTITETGEAASVKNADAKTVKVVVTDNGDGTLGLATTESDPTNLTFVNTYTATGELPLAGTKTLEGRAMGDNDVYEFDVTEVGGSTTTVKNEGASIKYPKLTYTLDSLGQHTYVITEKAFDKDGVKSATTSYTLNVFVADAERDGKLEITTSGADPQALNFVNTYTAKNDFKLEASKAMEGRTFIKGTDAYTFTVTAEQGVPMPAKTAVAVAPEDGSTVTVDFGTIPYTLADAGKEYTYTIAEAGTVAGVKNDSAKTVKIAIADNGDGTLNVTPTYETGDKLTFTNTYSASGIVNLEAKKQFEGRDWTDNDAFTFQLSGSEGAPMPEGSSEAKATKDAQTARFGDITYTLADRDKTYDYTITESAPEGVSARGITYDTATHTAHVHVSDSGDGTLATTVTYDDNKEDAPTFKNTYDAKGTFHLEGAKTMSNRDFNERDAYTFTVKALEEGAPMPEKTEVSIAPREGNTATIDFGNISYGLADVDKQYTYEITETGEVAGVTNDAAKHYVRVAVTDNGDGTLAATAAYLAGEQMTGDLTFHNSYGAKGTYELKGTKVMENRSFNANDTYTFSITADRDDAPMPRDEQGNEVRSITVTPAEGNTYDFSFGSIPFTLANDGTAYTYTMTESGTVPGVQNDIRFIRRKVTLMPKDNGDGTMAVQAVYDVGDPAIDAEKEAFTFRNTYTAKGTAEFNVTKKLTGKTLEEGEFTFQIKRDDWAQAVTKSNDASGKVTFATEQFDHKDVGNTYHYTISEVNGQNGAYTYDTTIHGVDVTISDNGDGTLKTSLVYDNNPEATGITFNNKYFKAEAALEFNKYFYSYGDGLFTFELKAANDQWQAREGAVTVATDDQIVDNGQAFQTTVTNGAFDEYGKATVALPKMIYYQPGTYRYTLAEVESGGENVASDQAVYHITVVVDDQLNAKPTYELEYNGQTSPIDAMDFYNNGIVAFGFQSASFTAMNSQAKVASATPAVKKVLENGSLKGDEFTFTLSDANGNTIQTAANDASGNVGFDRLQFDKAGTYEYTIVENSGSDATIVYDNSIIRYVVEVTTNIFNGDLEVKETYYNADGKVTTEPTFTNKFRTIKVRAQKCSREPPYDPLVGSTYGIWMANPNGNDIYMGNDTSDENGYLLYDVPTLKGYAYYLLEEAAPHGHLVDPYPTDYFTINKNENGYYLVYQNEPEFFDLIPELKGKL